jgi:hypothetical protein
MDERRGGIRRGAGRPKHPEILLTCSVKLTPAHMKLLRLWGGGNASAGLRWLIDAAKPLICQVETQE